SPGLPRAARAPTGLRASPGVARRRGGVGQGHTADRLPVAPARRPLRAFPGTLSRAPARAPRRYAPLLLPLQAHSLLGPALAYLPCCKRGAYGGAASTASRACRYGKDV